MSRRPSGEGTAPRRRPSGRFEARYRDGSGRRVSVFGKDAKSAEQALRKALALRDAGIRIVSARETVGSYLTGWLAGVQPSVRPRTFAAYKQITNQHLIPALGSVPLARLQPQQVQRLYADLLASGRSPKTTRNVGLVLHRALEQAVAWRVLQVNSAHSVALPRRQAKEMQALTATEARQVLAAGADDDLEALWWLALTVGLRQGELLALRWPEVDLDAGTLRVVASMVRIVGQAPFLGEPKSPKSRRQVELGNGAVEALRRHRQRELKAALAAGRPYDPDSYVFRRLDQRPLSVTTTWKRWRRLLDKAGVRRVRFHDARHTAATMLLGKGVHPKVVAELLGHSTVAITLDVYSHVTPAMHREAARVMSDLFPGRS